jgi:hypothetical protein
MRPMRHCASLAAVRLCGSWVYRGYISLDIPTLPHCRTCVSLRQFAAVRITNRRTLIVAFIFILVWRIHRREKRLLVTVLVELLDLFENLISEPMF